MTADTKLQWSLILEKLDPKIKIPRKCHVLPCNDISEFSYIFEILRNVIQGTKLEQCPKYSMFPSF